MDLTPTSEQKMLRDAAHKYLRAEYAFEARRQVMATETGMSAAHWRRFAELGWLGLGLPDEDVRICVSAPVGDCVVDL